MSTLQERFDAGAETLRRLGRADAAGVPHGGGELEELSPDMWRLIREACFGSLWPRPALSTQQRSLATISALVPLRRDENLRGHLLSGLDVGLSPQQIVEIIVQLLFYVGAPMATTALRVVHGVFRERSLAFEPIQVYAPGESPDALYERGVATRARVLGEARAGGLLPGDPIDDDWGRYLTEYMWGSVWPRPALDLQQRCLCTLTALMVEGTDLSIKVYALAARRLGLTEEQVLELCFHLTFYIGVYNARRAAALVRQAFAEK